MTAAHAHEAPARTGATVAWAALLTLPLVGLALLLAAPRLDVHWEDHPSHFWLVLAAAVTNVVLAVVTGDAARRRGDARLLLVSLAFLAAAGFLGLHALATPQVLLDTPNAGFVVATPVGLLVASAFAAASALELSPQTSRRLVARAGWLTAALFAAMGAWAAASLAGAAPLEGPLTEEEARGWLLAFAIPGIALYALAAFGYLRLYRRRPAPLLLLVVTAFVLLAESMVAIAAARNWHASWWEWHLLMLVAFALVAWGARREWREERFADLYLEATAGTVRPVSVLFADLEGFTTFSEQSPPEVVSAMLDTYLAAGIPAVRDEGGEVDKLIGDAIMAVFNLRGDQPDHATRAVRAALALQTAVEPIARTHPGWPRFRVGVNTGRAHVGLVGTTGGRDYTALGDAVNLASRLEGRAAAGEVVIGGETFHALPDGTTVEPLGGVQVKGKQTTVEAYVVRALPPDGHGRDEGEQP
jgi:class 3 adenylate cyclase